MTTEEILQERLERVKAIIEVMEQHNEVDHTILTQLRLALEWVPEEGQENE